MRSSCKTDGNLLADKNVVKVLQNFFILIIYVFNL